ncbi:ribosome small subunit-dependent GTPase A [Arthrobacter sp. ATCC 21022]|uniref:ribosome small subunit-dependent GTPase A n=1 Tax=Paenarthrobacter TaxID=1742992 RepID=UPI00074D397B|nr:ribosome small subunit-dependent GTPase [Arthrobacter sp. ATCC 21022]KUR62664.1 ribosome small subunit-dependent GTPase [Arthrobacter sp. ATCC 21022]KUR64381.1 ribosome small subunit-dependent GTPase [Arthrobacter sp. ATCC 21022]
MHTYASSSDRSITENSAAVNSAAPPAHGPIEYGFTPATAGHFRDNPVPEKGDCTPGRIVRLDRNRVLVASGECLLHLPYPSHGPAPATGDWVWLGRNTAGEPAVVAILPRLSALSRKRAFESSSEEQVLGANIDIVAVVVPMDRPLTHNRLERTLVAAWDSGATPLVVITKADLANIADDVVGEVLLQAAGVDVVTTSAEQGDGIDELLRHIPAGATLVMLGPSGAGKSTLINALTGSRQQATGAVRAGDGKGRHTTTSRELVPLPGGAVLMDTPGVRGFGLFDADDGMEEMFGDLEELFEQCRFSDCSHQAEPGCAVLEALAVGSLDQRRWDSYLKLQRELAALNRKHDAAARRAYQREWHQKVVSAERGQRAAERYRHDRAEERSARKGKRRKR